MSGIEIIGLAAAVLQIAEVGGKLSVRLFTFTRKVKHANKSIDALSQDIAATGAVLKQLGETLSKDDNLRVCSQEAVDTARTLVEDTKKVFAGLEKLTEGDEKSSTSGQKLLNWKQRFKFPFLEPQIEKVQANLERLKSSLLVILNLLIFAEQLRNKEALPVLKDQRELIRILALEKDENEKRYERILKAIVDKPVVSNQNASGADASLLKKNLEKSGSNISVASTIVPLTCNDDTMATPKSVADLLPSNGTPGASSENSKLTDTAVAATVDLDVTTPTTTPSKTHPELTPSITSLTAIVEPARTDPTSSSSDSVAQGSSSVTTGISVAGTERPKGLTKASPASKSTYPPTDQALPNIDLPPALKHHHARIQNHTNLVQNLLSEIKDLRYDLDHGTRDRMHTGVLEMHWNEWEQHRRRHGHKEFEKIFVDHNDIIRYWNDKNYVEEESMAYTTKPAERHPSYSGVSSPRPVMIDSPNNMPHNHLPHQSQFPRVSEPGAQGYEFRNNQPYDPSQYPKKGSEIYLWPNQPVIGQQPPRYYSSAYPYYAPYVPTYPPWHVQTNQQTTYSSSHLVPLPPPPARHSHASQAQPPPSRLLGRHSQNPGLPGLPSVSDFESDNYPHGHLSQTSGGYEDLMQQLDGPPPPAAYGDVAVSDHNINYGAFDNDDSDAEAAAGLAAMQLADEQDAAEEARRRNAEFQSDNKPGQKRDDDGDDNEGALCVDVSLIGEFRESAWNYMSGEIPEVTTRHKPSDSIQTNPPLGSETSHVDKIGAGGLVKLVRNSGKPVSDNGHKQSPSDNEMSDDGIPDLFFHPGLNQKKPSHLSGAVLGLDGSKNLVPENDTKPSQEPTWIERSTSLSHHGPAAVVNAPRTAINTTDLPCFPRKKLDPSNISAATFNKCTEPWAMSEVLAWIKSLAGVEAVEVSTVKRYLSALFRYKVSTMGASQADALAQQFVSGMYANGIFREGKTRGRMMPHYTMSGVVYQLTGRGCYTSRVHTPDGFPDQCYSPCCGRRSGEEEASKAKKTAEKADLLGFLDGETPREGTRVEQEPLKPTEEGVPHWLTVEVRKIRAIQNLEKSTGVPCEKDIWSNASIKFVDISGRSFDFPLYTCKKWVHMERLVLQIYEGDEKWGPLVRKGFKITDMYGRLVWPSMWESWVQPGVVVHLRLADGTRRVEADENTAARNEAIEHEKRGSAGQGFDDVDKLIFKFTNIDENELRLVGLEA